MNFFERRKQEKELERKIKIKEGRRRIERNIDKQKKKVESYTELAKRAVRLKDDAKLRTIASYILATQKAINRNESAMLSFDIMEAARDQAEVAAEFAKAYEVMAGSILANSNPAQVVKIQRDVQTALSRAEMMEDVMSDFMDISLDMVDDSSKELEQYIQTLRTEAAQETQGVENTEIDASLRAIEDLLRR